MNTKLKVLAAAVAFAASAGSAQAAIATFASGNGELFLNVRDNANGLSYVRDLGITLDGFLASPNVPTVAADATLTNFLAGKASNTLEWSVIAGDSLGENTGEQRYLSTTLADLTTVQTTTNSNLFQFKQVDPNVTAMNGDFWAQTQEAVAENLSYAGSGDGPGTAASGLESYYSPVLDQWFNNAPFYNTALVGETQNFFYLVNSAPTFPPIGYPAPVDVTEFGTFTLANDGTLSYADAASPVPVPAAVWLFGSGLVGMVGVARRKMSKA